MRFLSVFLASLAILVACVLLVFGTVNPLGGFWGHRFPPTIPLTRRTKEALFDAWQRTQPVEGLILGSSRSMKLDPEQFTQRTGHRFFNFAVTDGSLYDVRAVLSYVSARRAPLREIVIGVDPTMLTPEPLPPDLQSDWELEPRATGDGRTVWWAVKRVAALVKQSLSLSFAREVVRSITAKAEHKEPLHEFRADGYLEYRTRDRAIAAGTYNRAGMIRRCVTEYYDSLVSKHTFDPTRLALLRQILDSARKRGIHVTVWSTQAHPDFYAAVDSVPRLATWLRQATDTVRAIALAGADAYVDLHIIDAFGGDTTDWYDCVHVGPRNAARVADHVLAAPATGGP